jgi:hypothetical protein
MKTIRDIYEDGQVPAGLNFHIQNGIPLGQNIFRPHSENYYRLFSYARTMKESLTLDPFDRELLESDIGEFGEYEGESVPLDHPLIEASEVELNSPKRGGSKKFYVFVKNKNGRVIKVEFGDTTGKTAKINDPEARKSFAARHQCHLKTDKTTPGYWSCRLPTYAKQLGLKGGGNFFW